MQPHQFKIQLGSYPSEIQRLQAQVFSATIAQTTHELLLHEDIACIVTRIINYVCHLSSDRSGKRAESCITPARSRALSESAFTPDPVTDATEMNQTLYVQRWRMHCSEVVQMFGWLAYTNRYRPRLRQHS